MREDGIFEAAQTCHYYNQLPFPTMPQGPAGFRTGFRRGLPGLGTTLNHCIALALADP